MRAVASSMFFTTTRSDSPGLAVISVTSYFMLSPVVISTSRPALAPGLAVAFAAGFAVVVEVEVVVVVVAWPKASALITHRAGNRFMPGLPRYES